MVAVRPRSPRSSRDALVDAGKASATVWGHTEVGHTTTNWSLRRFRAAAGKGTAGEAFAGDIVFGAMRAGALAQVEAAVKAQGHEVVAARRADFERFALARLERQFYRGYGDANQRLTHGGANLAERAPVQPDAVAEVIRTHWRDTYWTATRVNAMATELIRRMKPMKIVQRVAAGRPGESFVEPLDAEQATAVTAAKDQIRTAVRGWGTDEAAILAALRGLTPPDLAEIGSDEVIIDLFRGDLNASELRAVGAVLARGRVGGFTRAELALVTANPGSHRLGTIAAALARERTARPPRELRPHWHGDDPRHHVRDRGAAGDDNARLHDLRDQLARRGLYRQGPGDRVGRRDA